MKTALLSFSSETLRKASVDTTNAVIRGVSVLTAGIVARGHDLAVDSVTIQQMLACAKGRGQVPVKVDHKSGAAAVCGYLDNFRAVGDKLKADWHLLQSHPQTPQILEVAQRMPSGVGLSASFLPPDNAEPGKARCGELLSVDYVTLPAANPDGLFSARVDSRQRKDPEAIVRARLARIGQYASVGAIGAAGASKLAGRGLDALAATGARRLRVSSRTRAGILGAAGALGAAYGVSVVRRHKPARDTHGRDFSARVRAILLARVAEQPADTTHKRNDLAKRVALRLAKTGAGAAAGAYVGKRAGIATGATAGAIAGLLFSRTSAARRAAAVGLEYAAKTARNS